MKNLKNNFDSYFENKDLSKTEVYSGLIVKSLVRSVLEPIASNNQKAIAFIRLKDIPEAGGLIKRLEYSSSVTLVEFTDFDFSKFDVAETGIIVISCARYNCALLFREVKEDKYEIYLKLNSKIVSDVYETLKTIFLINHDEEFYQYKPERRDNDLMNYAVQNVLRHFEETIEENEYNSKIRENDSVEMGTDESMRSLAHEIKNQLSVLDVYTKILETKGEDKDSIAAIRKTIDSMKVQVELFRNIDKVNLAETDIKAIITDSIKMYSNILKEKNNKIVFVDELAGVETNAFLDKEKFLIAMNNVIKNANEVTKDDEIIVKLAKDDGKIKISIINHGEAIKEKDKEKIFTSGFTTKKDGWGVGLSVCKKFIEEQFGTFELAKSDEKETEFLIQLPSA